MLDSDRPGAFAAGSRMRLRWIGLVLLILAAMALAWWGEPGGIALALIVADVPDKERPLLPYQARWVTDISPVKVCAKSRQIGITWATAFEAVMVASARAHERPGYGMDVFVMSMSADDARAFIETCAKWIRWLRPAVDALRQASEIEEGDWLRTDDDDDEIQAYRIRFPSGFSIYGLPSKPARLRGRTGYAICDEAAQQDLTEFRRAAGAFTMQLGRIAYISTYLGADNDFYRLVEEARDSETMSLHEISLTDALDDGLYQRIARKNRIPYTIEAEREWVESVRETYGDYFDEECLLIVDQSGGQEIPRAMIQRCATLGPDECTIIEVIARRGKPTRLMIDGEQVAESALPWDKTPPEDMREETIRWLDAHLSPVLSRLDGEGLDIHPGLDFGKEQDLTCYSFLQRTRTNLRRLRLHIELEHVPWPIQDLIADYCWPRLRNRIRSGCGDKGGPGANSVDRASQATGGRIIGVNISDAWHATAWTRLRKRFEQDMIRIARHHKPLEDDLASIRRRNGKIRPPKSKAGRRGQQRHADAAVSLALAEQAIEREPEEESPAPPVRKGYSRADLARAQRRRQR